MPTKVFGGSETQKCVLIGTSATNIVNISAHHTIFGIFHQPALCFLFSVWFRVKSPISTAKTTHSDDRLVHFLVIFDDFDFPRSLRVLNRLESF